MSVFMSCLFPFAPMRQISKLTRGFFQLWPSSLYVSHHSCRDPHLTSNFRPTSLSSCHRKLPKAPRRLHPRPECSTPNPCDTSSCESREPTTSVLRTFAIKTAEVEAILERLSSVSIQLWNTCAFVASAVPLFGWLNLLS